MAKRDKPSRNHRAVTELARQLGALLSELDLTEIEASIGGVRVRLQRASAPAPVAVQPIVAAAAAVHPSPVAEVAPTSMITIEAPMVGTFYRASSPTAEPFAHEGDVVKEGQVLCIIEAMKLMNEIESRASGRIAKILVENGQPVEYGQPLFLIEPGG
ncbi:MAG: acetyl-CoA carboxylase, biotin carboxyl carrier protein [Candidatus Rokubacteria bacterium 13_1_40CM_69_27]|nr:MAG: acetyl-CoA carboxylase, biotin carboxyl carrier protein [Candidatus Rokubacteria bacterium 13_1_40CM_69_27]OLC31918.1 MAG: acetyl-CoA carboxylase, biotin carboxyl carrier protein [Candidatus Rokubacteria bacterium 13_1_40CM_4_69_5]OLE38718.1 MAG: acetyl-CoA carboxylase, biotin carboxyl carrier protein [Candidatus Rokubacteria bacterium 13_1_20CM_2_70_7]